MINVVVPLAGKGQRMVDGGYEGPKALIMAGDKHIIDYGIESLDLRGCNLIFVVRCDHVCSHDIAVILGRKFAKSAADVHFVVAEHDTRGAVETCSLARPWIDNTNRLVIFCPDVYFRPRFKPEAAPDGDGHILTFKANSANYSYVQQDIKGHVTRTAEKLVISDDASVGVYCFRTGHEFLRLADEAMAEGGGAELYICPLYNRLVARGGIVTTEQVEQMYVMGTPSELKFFEDAIFPYFLPRSFILCSDHSGYAMKEDAARILTESKVAFVDCGCYTNIDCDYGHYVARAVAARRWAPGAMILAFCRSGQGVNIAANKHHGIRSAVVTCGEDAALAIRHNAANCLAVAAGKAMPSDVLRIITASVAVRFDGGRHQNRLMSAGV